MGGAGQIASGVQGKLDADGNYLEYDAGGQFDPDHHRHVPELRIRLVFFLALGEVKESALGQME